MNGRAAPSPVELVVGWLEGRLGVRAGSKVPDGLVLPFNEVTKFGGAMTSPGIDLANLDVDSYAGPGDGTSAADEAESLAERVRNLMLFELPGTRFPEHRAWISQVTEISSPVEREYDATDSDVGRYQAAYAVTVRSRT